MWFTSPRWGFSEFRLVALHTLTSQYTRICQGWGAEAGTSSGTSADGRLVQTFVSGLVGRGSGLTQDEVHISCFIRFIRVMLCHSHSQTLFLSFHSLLESLRNAVAKRTVYKRATQLSPSSTGSKAGDTSSYRISGAFLSCWRLHQLSQAQTIAQETCCDSCWGTWHVKNFHFCECILKVQSFCNWCLGWQSEQSLTFAPKHKILKA